MKNRTASANWIHPISVLVVHLSHSSSLTPAAKRKLHRQYIIIKWGIVIDLNKQFCTHSPGFYFIVFWKVHKPNRCAHHRRTSAIAYAVLPFACNFIKCMNKLKYQLHCAICLSWHWSIRQQSVILHSVRLQYASPSIMIAARLSFHRTQCCYCCHCKWSKLCVIFYE